MPQSELSPKNYKRISLINWLLAVPLIVIFSWPYLFISHIIKLENFFAWPGMLFFASSFALTILHGHVTMALGSLHRHHYYDWLEEKNLSYGLLFHPSFCTTRFRLILFVISIGIMLTGWIAAI